MAFSGNECVPCRFEITDNKLEYSPGIRLGNRHFHHGISSGAESVFLKECTNQLFQGIRLIALAIPYGSEVSAVPEGAPFTLIDTRIEPDLPSSKTSSLPSR